MNNLHSILPAIPLEYLIWADAHLGHEYKYENGHFYHWRRNSSRWQIRELQEIADGVYSNGYKRISTGIPINLKVL
jgi:hypothetical protein